MQAVINVKGTKLSVVNLSLDEGKLKSVSVIEEGNYETYYDSKHAHYIPEGAIALDLSKALEFPDTNKQIVEDLNKLIKDSRDYLNDLGEKIIQEVLTHNGLPFGDSTLPNLAKEYKEQSDYIDGVVSALEVVKRDNFA